MATDEKERSASAKKPIDFSKLPDELVERGREVWLAGLGALARVEEEGDRVFQDLVKRGKSYEEKRRGQFEDATSEINSEINKQQESISEELNRRFDDVSRRVSDAAQTVEKTVSSTLNDTLGRLGVPTREEVQGLSSKVGQLSEKLDALSSMLDQQAAGDALVFHVAYHEDAWVLLQEGTDAPLQSFDTKKEAVDAARDAAKAHAPSRLVIQKQDGAIQETISYDAEDDA
ncbi:MAG: phasin family protein [Longimonas sp.]|uniref:phasin family protein n=1 Tax=Longimonas sp. TaxID=2039626 RepID=UPI00397489BF